MTTTPFEMQRMGIMERMAQWKPLVDQYEQLQRAAREYQELQGRLDNLDREEQRHKAAQLEQAKASITSMTLKADPTSSDVLASVPVLVARRNGTLEQKALHNLDRIEDQVMIERFWRHVPAAIRQLAATPEAALQRYKDAKRRGFLKG